MKKEMRNLPNLPKKTQSKVSNGRNGAADVEAAALACVLQAGTLGSQSEVDSLLLQLKPAMFQDARHRTIHGAATVLRIEEHALDLVTLTAYLKARGQLRDAGGQDYVARLPDAAPSIVNFSTYLADLKTAALKRWTASKSAKLAELASADSIDEDTLKAEFAELYDRANRIGHTRRPRLKMWTPAELETHKPDPAAQLVGDNEIFKGYEGLFIIAGPGSSGKSLAAFALALAGCVGSGHWQGRKVHRRFKTAFIQAENGARRLKDDILEAKRHHPELAATIDQSILISDPPEGGLPFHHADFRAAVRRMCESFGPDLVVIDPWSQVASDDGQKEVIEKLAEIRSCFPGGEACPALGIVAHTKKPRAEEVRAGRALVHTVAGSIALVNTARCVYMLLPWSNEPEDARIYWACVKLNDGEMYPASVWKRKRGTLFEHDPSVDPREWGKEPNDERRAVTEEHLRDCFTAGKPLKKTALVRALAKVAGASEATCYRAIDEDGYLRRFLARDVAAQAWKLRED